jgi:hypothetical protein
MLGLINLTIVSSSDPLQSLKDSFYALDDLTSKLESISSITLTLKLDDIVSFYDNNNDFRDLGQDILPELESDIKKASSNLETIIIGAIINNHFKDLTFTQQYKKIKNLPKISKEILTSISNVDKNVTHKDIWTIMTVVIDFNEAKQKFVTCSTALAKNPNDQKIRDILGLINNTKTELKSFKEKLQNLLPKQ